jgi:hypothetical protein
MKRGDLIVDLDIKEVLGADRRAVLLLDLVGETMQGEPPRSAGVSMTSLKRGGMRMSF